MTTVLMLFLAILPTVSRTTRAFVLLTGEGWPHSISREELPARGWLGLYDDGAAPRVRRVGLRLTEAGGGDRPEVVVDSRPAGAAILFHGVPGITAGAVTRAGGLEGNGALVKPGDTLHLSLGRKRYLLTLLAESDQLKNARIVLEGEGRRQILFSLDGDGDEPHFEVLWAGDLDRDGKLDLVMTMSRKYSDYPRSVLLSSFSQRGALVREVANFDEYGC